MIITGIEVQALQDAFLSILLISSISGFFFGSFLYLIYSFAIRRINAPRKTLRTLDGLLYRTNSGFYVKKELVDSLNSEFKLKNRERWIKHHERQIEFLRRG